MVGGGEAGVEACIIPICCLGATANVNTIRKTTIRGKYSSQKTGPNSPTPPEFCRTFGTQEPHTESQKFCRTLGAKPSFSDPTNSYAKQGSFLKLQGTARHPVHNTSWPTCSQNIFLKQFLPLLFCWRGHPCRASR